MISTAPESRARMMVSEPFSAKLEQITTGIGYWDMSLRRKVKPSIRGISTSRVITSGTSRLIRSAAIKGSPAVAMIWISGSLDNTSERV